MTSISNKAADTAALDTRTRLDTQQLRQKQHLATGMMEVLVTMWLDTYRTASARKTSFLIRPWPRTKLLRFHRSRNLFLNWMDRRLQRIFIWSPRILRLRRSPSKHSIWSPPRILRPERSVHQSGQQHSQIIVSVAQKNTGSQ